MRWAAILLALGTGMVAPLALGAPPPDADPALAPWFQGLSQPNGQSCCSEADCRPVESRSVADHYQAFAEGRWIDVPNDKIIQPRGNPTGRAVLCMAPGRPDLVYCFVRPVET